MFFTINRYLFAAMLGLIGLDLLTERLTDWLLPMHWTGRGDDLPSLLLALGYFCAAAGVLIFFRSGPAVEFWKMVLKSNKKLTVILGGALSILQVVLWVQVLSVLKMGHSCGLDVFELNTIAILQYSLPVLLVVAIPLAIVLRKWKDSFVNKMVAELSATISDSTLNQERTHKVKRISRPKLRHVQMRKCG